MKTYRRFPPDPPPPWLVVLVGLGVGLLVYVLFMQ